MLDSSLAGVDIKSWEWIKPVQRGWVNGIEKAPYRVITAFQMVVRRGACVCYGRKTLSDHPWYFLPGCAESVFYIVDPERSLTSSTNAWLISSSSGCVLVASMMSRVRSSSKGMATTLLWSNKLALLRLLRLERARYLPDEIACINRWMFDTEREISVLPSRCRSCLTGCLSFESVKRDVTGCDENSSKLMAFFVARGECVLTKQIYSSCCSG